MTDLRRLCGALSNGCPEPIDLRLAEDFLRSALAAASNARFRTGFLAPWEAGSVPPPEDSGKRRRFLGALAPALLLEGVWLAAAAQPATAHRPGENLLCELYCRIMGLDDPARSPPLRFRAALTLAGLHLPPLDDPGFFEHPRIPDCALAFPCLHLSLRHRPRSFFPELLGYTLAHCARKPAWWDDALPDSQALRTGLAELALAALESYPGKDDQAERIRAGWALYRSSFESLLRETEAHLARRCTAEEAMAALVQANRSFAIGYHKHVRLGGRTLDQWLEQSGPDVRPLLHALADSPWIDRNCPEASRLIRAMDFGGPMFGVFDAAERQVCLDWIENPQKPSAGYPVVAASKLGEMSTEPDPAPLRQLNGTRRSVPAKLSNRKLYTALLRAESPGDCPPAADAFIRAILRRSRRLRPLQSAHRRGFIYTPDGFRRYVENLHRREVERYRLLPGPPRIGREFCRWAALQLAPAILVDGAWLAGIPTAAERLGEAGRHLLKIYADELGNGHCERNHPNVYRRLLESLEFDLPAVDSEAFAGNPGFLEAAFDIPVYLLAMGLATERYFPELLGLNLAIELSGLGAGYMKTIDILRHHGIDPAIIRLHLSIDNLASGHAARAREAIVLVLDEVRRREGREAVQCQWERIWTGYLSLNTAALGLTVRFGLRYFGQRFGPQSLQSRRQGD